MIKFENTDVVGWEYAIRGMRNPMDSWEKSDSGCLFHMVQNYSNDDPMAKEYTRYLDEFGLNLKIGPNDHDLMMRLRNAGTDHRKFMRMIAVYVDITAPLYWWKEFDTYKVGTVANSCSTMHKIHAKEFALEDFSCEHLNRIGTSTLWDIIDTLNIARNLYLEGGEYKGEHYEAKDKRVWWQMIQLLPSSYNQKRTVMLNYEVLANIYKSRRAHKLDEWRVGFMEWIESLPYSEIITGEIHTDDN